MKFQAPDGPYNPTLDFNLREVGIFLLDGNQVRRYRYNTQEGLAEILRSFWENDAYFPRPIRKEDVYTWSAFKGAYLKQCTAYGQIAERFGGMFISAVEEESFRRALGAAKMR